MRFAWSTSDPSIAVVDSGGTVTPVRPGTVEVMASAHKVGKATLVILPATETIEVSPALDSIFVDEPIVGSRDIQQLTATATDPFCPLTGVFSPGIFGAHGGDRDVAGVKCDRTRYPSITATSNGKSATSSIRVVPLVARVELTSPPSQVLTFDTLQLVAVARGYDDAPMTRTFTWVSSNPSVATVSAGGRAIFLTNGQTTLTARTAFRTASVTVTVLERQLITLDAGEDFTCGSHHSAVVVLVAEEANSSDRLRLFR
jgi:hypothetical protein